MLLDDLEKKGLIAPPPFLRSNTVYLTIMGSHAYGVADTSVKDKIPDYDIYGFCVPPKAMVFPHLTGHIYGFGKLPQIFDQWQKHHILDESAHGGHGQEWDLTIFGIVKYFQLLLESNPNTITSLFTPENCVIHCSDIGRMVRDNRKLFLSKEVWKRFRMYAFSQLKKMDTKVAEGGRREIVEKYGYDVKFAYNVLRLLSEAEQILLTGDLDIQKEKEAMKSIRRGEWKIEEVREWFMAKDAALEAEFVNCKLPNVPPEDKIGELLLQCLEEHYGSLKGVFEQPDWAMSALRELDEVVNKYRPKLYT